MSNTGDGAWMQGKRIMEKRPTQGMVLGCKAMGEI